MNLQQEEVTKKELEKPPSPKPDTTEGSSKPTTPTKEGNFWIKETLFKSFFEQYSF